MLTVLAIENAVIYDPVLDEAGQSWWDAQSRLCVKG
jgi:hypothetical protein